MPSIVARRTRIVHDLDRANENSARQILGRAAERSVASGIPFLLSCIDVNAAPLMSRTTAIFKALEAAENELGVGLANAERDSARHFH